MWLVKSVIGKGVNRVKQLDSYLKKKIWNFYFILCKKTVEISKNLKIKL